MRDSTVRDEVAFIAPTITESYEILPGRADAGLVIVCDHALNRIPDGYGTLGLPPAEFERHIAYDIGAFEVARRISQKLGAPGIGARFSRLLIDVNRSLDDPTLIMRLSDGAIVPGNRHVDDTEREKRVRTYYEPYHLALDNLIDLGIEAGKPPALLSIHSFTPHWKGTPRPWHAAILWDRDYRFTVPLLEALRTDKDIVVGENEPYSGKLAGDCMWQHGTRRGIAHTLVELRQDLIADAKGQGEWAKRLATATAGVLKRKDLSKSLHTVHYFGSHTDDKPTPPFTSPAGQIEQCNE